MVLGVQASSSPVSNTNHWSSGPRKSGWRLGRCPKGAFSEAGMTRATIGHGINVRCYNTFFVLSSETHGVTFPEPIKHILLKIQISSNENTGHQNARLDIGSDVCFGPPIEDKMIARGWSPFQLQSPLPYLAEPHEGLFISD